MPEPTPPTPRRLWTFRILTGITAALVVFALPNLLAPWFDINLNPAIQHPELERWHAAVEGSGDAAAFVALLVLLWRPARNPLLAVSFALSAVVAAVLVLPFTGPSILFILLPVVLVVATYPYWGLLPHVRRHGVRPIPSLFAVGVLGSAALAAPVTTALQRQIAGIGDMAATNQWATYAEHCTSLALGALLVSVGLPGWRVMAATLAARCLYLGTVAVALPTQPDSWGTLGGAAALAAGAVIGYAAITARRSAVMGTRRRVSAAAITGGAALAVAGVASLTAAPPATAAATRAGERLHLIAQEGTVTPIDLGEKGFGVGDEYVLSDRLYRNGHAVGRDAGTCTVVTAEGDAVCDLVLALPAGDLMVHGLLPGVAHEIRLAVTGGTGRYATARGDVLLQQGESSSTLDVRLAP
jgi:hypothetical protein